MTLSSTTCPRRIDDSHPLPSGGGSDRIIRDFVHDKETLELRHGQKLHGFPAILCGRDMAIPSRFLRGLSFTPQKQHVKTVEVLCALAKTS
jgi:hypothetical protein